MYCEEITLKIFCLENYPLKITRNSNTIRVDFIEALCCMTIKQHYIAIHNEFLIGTYFCAESTALKYNPAK